MEEKISKKKILYVITKSNWGGAQKNVFDLATNMPKEKYDVTVIAGGNGFLIKKLQEKNIRTIPLLKLERDPNLISDIISIWNLFKLIRQEEPDILHLHSTKIGVVGTLLGQIHNGLNKIYSLLKIRKVKTKALIIFTVHGWAFKENRPNHQKVIIWLSSWLTVLLSKKVITVSKDDLEKTPAHFSKDKIYLIHNGIEPSQTKQRKEARAEIFGNKEISEKNLTLGCIAELHKNKGLNYAIEAITEIKKQNADKDRPVLLVIIGDGEQRKNLENMIIKNGLAESVILVGQKENARTFLSAFDLFILPSIKEGLPYCILEAGVVGLPVIATNVGGINEIITDMETGILIRPADSKEISNALKFFIQNPEKIAEFGGKLKKRISEEFSLEKMIEKTMAVYEIT
jgi:glycosyltransferase involved in cell wall biosynthesis